MTDELKAGDRIELVKTTDPWTDLGPGTRGVLVTDPRKSEGIGAVPSRYPGCHPENTNGYECAHADHDNVVTEYTTLSPKWDNGSWLMMIPEAGDVVKKIEPDATCPKCNSTEHVIDVDFNIKPEGGWWECTACNHKFEHRVVVKATPLAKIA